MPLSNLTFTEVTIISQNFHSKYVENMKCTVTHLFRSSRKSMIVSDAIFKKFTLAGQFFVGILVPKFIQIQQKR
jgi:hypothetical protein